MGAFDVSSRAAEYAELQRMQKRFQAQHAKGLVLAFGSGGVSVLLAFLAFRTFLAARLSRRLMPPASGERLAVDGGEVELPLVGGTHGFHDAEALGFD